VRPRRLEVKTEATRYPVLIGAGVSAELPRLLAEKMGLTGVFLVTDTNVDSLHGDRVMAMLRSAGLPARKLVVPAGERSKSAEQLLRLWRAMVEDGCDRGACVVALGGGVVGDLAGFAAASVLRGIDSIQVPTSLLAMVDASVGGKTGIDLPEGKNLVGAFHQPRAVVMDLDFLATLPERELRSGWAEVIKAAAIRDEGLFRRIEAERVDLLARAPERLAEAIEASVRIKAAVVGADEKESGLRRILNFGHTLAHGLEAVSGYVDLLHGEAVAVGMVFAGELGERLGVTPAGVADRLRALTESFGLPSKSPGGASIGDLLRAMGRDKKRGPGGIHWVILERIGSAVVTDEVPEPVLVSELERFLGETGRASP
jgi:3-dehydroquinate synthase